MAREDPLREVRISDELWNTAVAIAERRGQTVAQVVRDALAVYAVRHA